MTVKRMLKNLYCFFFAQKLRTLLSLIMKVLGRRYVCVFAFVGVCVWVE